VSDSFQIRGKADQERKGDKEVMHGGPL